LLQAVKDKQDSCLTWDAEKLVYHQGYITALLEIIDSDYFSKEN